MDVYRAIGPKVHPVRKMECSRQVVERREVQVGVSHQNARGTTSEYTLDDGGASPILSHIDVELIGVYKVQTE